MPSTSDLAGVVMDAINRCDESLLRSICSSTYQGFDASRESTQRGRMELLEDLRKLNTAFPNREISTIHEMSNGDSAAVLWMLKGKHLGPFMGIPATSRSVTVCGCSHLEFQNGRLHRALHLWDMAALLRSLRLLPDLPHRQGDRSLAHGVLHALSKPTRGSSPQPMS